MRFNPLNKNSLQPTLRVENFPELLEELDESNEQSLIGGSFTGDDKLRIRLNSEATSVTGLFIAVIF